MTTTVSTGTAVGGYTGDMLPTIFLEKILAIFYKLPLWSADQFQVTAGRTSKKETAAVSS